MRSKWVNIGLFCRRGGVRGPHGDDWATFLADRWSCSVRVTGHELPVMSHGPRTLHLCREHARSWSSPSLEHEARELVKNLLQQVTAVCIRERPRSEINASHPGAIKLSYFSCFSFPSRTPHVQRSRAVRQTLANVMREAHS